MCWIQEVNVKLQTLYFENTLDVIKDDLMTNNSVVFRRGKERGFLLLHCLPREYKVALS